MRTVNWVWQGWASAPDYIEVAMIRPDPAKTWDLVAKMSGGKKIPVCNLFGSHEADVAPGVKAPTWAGARRQQ